MPHLGIEDVRAYDQYAAAALAALLPKFSGLEHVAVAKAALAARDMMEERKKWIAEQLDTKQSNDDGGFRLPTGTTT
jgi:hypothetical protein